MRAVYVYIRYVWRTTTNKNKPSISENVTRCAATVTLGSLKIVGEVGRLESGIDCARAYISSREIEHVHAAGSRKSLDPVTANSPKIVESCFIRVDSMTSCTYDKKIYI